MLCCSPKLDVFQLPLAPVKTRPSPSHAKPCWLVAAIHPESTTNWPETKAIEHAPPFTGHEQGGRDFDFGNVSSPRPLI